MLTKEQIISASRLKFEEIDVPEWGGSVRISVMSAKDRDAYDASTFKLVGKEIKPDMTNARSKLLSRCIVDADGAPMFTIDELAEMDSVVLDRLVAVARRINGMTEDSIEDEVKN